MSQVRSRALRGGVTAALLASAALSVGATPALAGPTVTLKYLCTYPLIGEQPLSIVINSDIPSSVPANTPTNAFHVDTVATAGGNTITGLTLVSATTIEGVAKAGASIAGPEANLPVTVPIDVTKFNVPPGQTSGDLVLNATGSTPAITFSKQGLNTIKLESLALNLKASRADGTAITEFSAVQTPPPTDNDPATFDISCRLDPAAGTQSTTIGTINVTAPTDPTPPSVPGKPTVGTLTSSTAVVSWGAATDNVGVVGYDVYTGGSRVASTTTATTVTVPNLGAGQTHNFTVKARDAAGNRSAASESTPGTTLPDTIVSGTADPSTLPPISLTMSCKYPMIGQQSLPLRITTNIPKANMTNAFLPAFNIVSIATLSSQMWDALNLVGAKTIEGSAIAVSRVSAPGFSLPIQLPIRINKTTVPGTRAAFSLQTTGITPPLIFQVSGTAKFTVDTIALNLSLKRADGSVIPLPSIGTDSDNNPNTFDANCGLSPATQAGLIGNTTLLKDITAPAAPDKPTVSAITKTGATLAWNKPTDDVGVESYEVTYNGTTKTTFSPTLALTGLTAGTSYTVTVKAKDAGGNSSSASPSLTFSTLP